MPVKVRLGKKPAVADHRIPKMSVVAPSLPAPPASADWYSLVKSWGMLANDELGCCVEAAVLHCIEQMSEYASHLLTPTSAEAVSFYEKAAGYIPGDPSTDQGSIMMGPGGVMEYWLKTGVMCGGKLNKVGGYLQITQMNVVEWMQGIHYFGGMLTGIMLPEAIVAGDTVPSVWADYSGPPAGGHEIWINGYENTTSGREFDLISWGAHYRATEEFLLHCVDEIAVVVDTVEINARGVDASNLSLTQLESIMGTLRHEA